MITNQDLHNEVTFEFTRFKNTRTNRQHRMKFAERLTEKYFIQHGNMPATHVLDRMATLILQDELADNDRMKMRNTEYPLLSDTQELYRKKDERSLKAAQDVATDGVDYRIRTRDSDRRMREVFG